MDDRREQEYQDVLLQAARQVFEARDRVSRLKEEVIEAEAAVVRAEDVHLGLITNGPNADTADAGEGLWPSFMEAMRSRPNHLRVLAHLSAAGDPGIDVNILMTLTGIKTSRVVGATAGAINRIARSLGIPVPLMWREKDRWFAGLRVLKRREIFMEAARDHAGPWPLTVMSGAPDPEVDDSDRVYCKGCNKSALQKPDRWEEFRLDDGEVVLLCSDCTYKVMRADMGRTDLPFTNNPGPSGRHISFGDLGQAPPWFYAIFKPKHRS